MHVESEDQRLMVLLQRSMELAREKGASSWLTVLPLSEHGFGLHKSGFQDAMALRYGWTPKNAPSKCECGKVFTVEHALSCPKGGFPILRHNEIRDFTASLLTEVCHDVRVEPELQPLTGESLTNATANTKMVRGWMSQLMGYGEAVLRKPSWM